jgi:hypothetical protein
MMRLNYGKSLRSIRIQHSKPGISLLIKEQLNPRLMLAELEPIDSKVLVNPYNDLIVNCASKGSKCFNKVNLLKLCQKERLYFGQPLILKDEIPVGIRSFLPFTQTLEEETNHITLEPQRNRITFCGSIMQSEVGAKPSLMRWNWNVRSSCCRTRNMTS